jgi:hypothetical protein
MKPFPLLWFLIFGVGLWLVCTPLAAQSSEDTVDTKQTKVWFGSSTRPSDRQRPHIYPLVGFHLQSGRVGPYWLNQSALGLGAQMRNTHTFQIMVGSPIGPPPQQVLIDGVGLARTTNVKSTSFGIKYQYQYSFQDSRWALYGSMGIQGFLLRFDLAPGLYDNFYSNQETRLYQEELMALLSELGFLLNVVRFLRLRFGLQYAFAVSSSTPGFALEPRDFRAPQLSVGFEISDFRFRRK